MNKHIGCTLTALLLSCVSALAQITGTVLDSKTKEPLMAATVVVEGSSEGVVTDLDGKFSLSTDQTSGTLVVSYISYVAQEISFSSNNLNIGEVKLELDAIGLEEVKVSASYVDQRKTPVAVSSITNEQITQRFSGLSVPDIVTSTPGIYTTQGAGGYGDQEIYIRGFDQTNVAFMINGIPVNDMENGRMYWSNFAGISEATREMQVQRGLGASKLAVSSIGGTVNMISQPAKKSKGGSFEYMNSNATWNNRLRFTINTGESDNGWAMTFQGSRTTTSPTLPGQPGGERGPIRPGAFVDAWSYYLAVSKQLNKRHQLFFYAFGAPFKRGSAWGLSERLKNTGDYSVTDNQFNYATGYYNGEFFNSRQNQVHKPQFSLSHHWDIDDATTLSTSAYISIAKVTSDNLRVTASEGANGYDVNKTTPAVRDAAIRTPDGYIDFDLLVQENLDASNTVTVLGPNGDFSADPFTGQRAENFIEARHNDHIWYGMISSLDKQVGNTDLKFGLDLRNYKGTHYVTAADLLGADFVTNTDRGEYDKFSDGNATEYDMNLLTSNEVIRTGDRFMYDYDGYINWGSVFAQAEHHFKKIDVFGTLSGTYSNYKRIGHFWNEEFVGSSLGKSADKTFLTYTAKAGVNYRITNRHKVFANAGSFTRPPFMRNSYQDARYSNNYVNGLKKERVYAVEAGYSFTSGFLKANINAYYTNWQDIARNLSDADDNDVQIEFDEYFSNVPGLRQVHKGIEIDFVWNVLTSLEVNGYVSIADYKTQVPESIPYVGVPPRAGEEIPVGNTAMRTGQLGLHYKGIKDMYVGARASYSGRLYMQTNPIDPYYAGEDIERLPDYTLFDIYLGRYFDISNDLRGRISANVNNVLDKEYIRWANRFFGPAYAYGFGRNYYLSVAIYF
ncbi:TonB-dependent receptor [Reichenbachiella versicolor]|uniref:TonB-dependent receptor n=1 Tax=Reichenbachiella versicolor TaxID=1821036 RepID=UPI000D6E7CF1|nr:TonB-dependent receptor [Reichenbachiella versicolor]